MKRSPYAKAIVAVLAAAATPLAAAFAANGALTSADLYTALATAIVSGGAVFGVKNGGTTVAGLVVKVVADLDRFKAALDVALQASLVIEPQPAAAGLSSAVAGAVYPTPDPAAPPVAG